MAFLMEYLNPPTLWMPPFSESLLGIPPKRLFPYIFTLYKRFRLGFLQVEPVTGPLVHVIY